MNACAGLQFTSLQVYRLPGNQYPNIQPTILSLEQYSFPFSVILYTVFFRHDST